MYIGTLDNMVEDIIKSCNRQQIPVVFAMKKYDLGRCINKDILISSIAILNYEGVNELFKQVRT